MRLRPEVQPQSFEDPQIAQITQISGSRGGWPQGSFLKIRRLHRTCRAVGFAKADYADFGLKGGLATGFFF